MSFDTIGRISGAMAQEGQSAAAFFRADRKRYLERNGYGGRRLSRIPGRYRSWNRAPSGLENLPPVDDTFIVRREAERSASRSFSESDLSSARRVTVVRGGGGGRALCVRLCDGYYFPVNGSTSPVGVLNARNVCQQRCPGAKSELFIQPDQSGDVDTAYSSRRSIAYAALKNAFAYRKGRAKQCTCKPASSASAQNMSLRKDTTLRRGDIVMTEEGFRVVTTGARNASYQKKFASLRKPGVRRVLPDGKLRSKLIAMQRFSLMPQKRLMKYLVSERSDGDMNGEVLQPPQFMPLPPSRPLTLARQ
ncbi:MAG: DUF2865 domain-containing protein [Hyphomicrobiales bacterium]|nr:DUF2865 domain-containing protein [Hyphomicrobiales bacterium]